LTLFLLKLSANLKKLLYVNPKLREIDQGKCMFWRGDLSSGYLILPPLFLVSGSEIRYD